MKELKDALEKIKNAAENHPCFCGYEEDDVTFENINEVARLRATAVDD